MRVLCLLFFVLLVAALLAATGEAGAEVGNDQEDLEQVSSSEDSFPMASYSSRSSV